MGRPPASGAPAFRFISSEVAEMESYLKTVNNAVPPRDVVNSLAEKFSGSEERLGKVVVQPKQVWNWFQNRRYSNRSKLHKTPAKLALSTTVLEDSISHRNVTNPVHSTAAPGKKTFDNTMEFEAKSVRDGAWYDVGEFLAVRNLENGDPEVQIRLSGLGIEENEWVNVRECIRQRSLPCDGIDCAAVLPGDLILCFQEGTDQALYFNAHVLDTQRRRHDMRGCRCRFLVRYDHDQSEEIVPLKKICRRPETEYRMQGLLRSRPSASDKDSNEAVQKSIRPPKLTDVNKDGTSNSNFFQAKEQPLAVAVTQMKESPVAVAVTQMKEPSVKGSVTQTKEPTIVLALSQMNEPYVAVASTHIKESPVSVAVTQMKEPPIAVQDAAASIVDGSSLVIPGVSAIDATKNSSGCENLQQ